MNKVYMWVGTFAVIMMIYLFLAPKLVKKPGGAPPRAGSNAEKMAIQQAAAGVPTASMPAAVEDFPVSSGFYVPPEGGRGPAGSMIPGSSATSFGGSDVGGFKLGQAYRARRRARRARRAFRGIRSKAKSLNLFPFAGVALA